MEHHPGGGVRKSGMLVAPEKSKAAELPGGNAVESWRGPPDQLLLGNSVSTPKNWTSNLDFPVLVW